MTGHMSTLLRDCLFKVAKEIGSRPIGSAANRRTREYLLGELGRLSLPVSIQELPAEYSCTTASKVEFVGATTQKPDSWPAFGSCSTDRLIAPIVDCGCGTPEEIPPEIFGSVGLVRRETLQEEAQVRNLAEAGAVAALLYVDFENALYSARVSKRVSAIPAAVIRKRDAELIIRDTPSRPAAVSLAIEGELRSVECANIIVDWSIKGQPHTVICAHYDSRPFTAGANDNASGVACVLALTKSLLEPRPRAPLRIVFFDGEEMGLIGSTGYAESEWAEDCKRVINIDAIGAGRLSLLTRDRAGDLDKQLADLAMAVARDLGVGIKAAASRTGISDHAPLRNKGACTLWFSDHPNAGRETDIDVAEAVDIQELENTCSVVSKLLEYC
jgi:aminopeptidase YwaD